MNILRLSRRSALGLGLAGLGALALTPRALAAPALRWPLRLAYARVDQKGFLHIRSDEQLAWIELQTRLGRLMETLQPLQPENMFGAPTLQVEGGPNCAMVARQMAAASGFDQLILYATHDGQKTHATEGNWFSDVFASLQGALGRDGRATGEAHLLDVSGGAPLVTVTADAGPRDPLNLFDNTRNPERETLKGLTLALERRFQDLAREAYASQRSIAGY
jgi:hypothetical protein